MKTTARNAVKGALTRLGWLPAARAARQLFRRASPSQIAKARRVRLRRWRLQALYARWLGPGQLCFDIGANVGARIEIFRELGARVVAAEPNPACLDALHRHFAADPEVIIVPKAVAAQEGELEIFLSSDLQTSSLSKDWIEAVSYRLEGHSWTEPRTVPVTTCDRLIADHGTPTFCKIDVEGFELEVLSGLSTPIPALSFEYTPERLDAAFGCLDRLAELGPYRFNYSVGEDFELVHPDWLEIEDFRRSLGSLGDSRTSGDVYAKLRP